MNKKFKYVEIGKSIYDSKAVCVRMEEALIEKIAEFGGMKGSFHIFLARLFGMSPACFLRMLCSNYSATLFAKENSFYIVPVFYQTKDAERFAAEVEHRLKFIFGD